MRRAFRQNFTVEELRRETAVDGTLASHCRSNRRRARSDLRYMVVPARVDLRARARAVIA